MCSPCLPNRAHVILVAVAPKIAAIADRLGETVDRIADIYTNTVNSVQVKKTHTKYYRIRNSRRSTTNRATTTTTRTNFYRKTHRVELPRSVWTTLNRIRSDRGKRNYFLHKQGFADTPDCSCGAEQTVKHIALECAQTKFEGGIVNICRYNTKAIPWMRVPKVGLQTPVPPPNILLSTPCLHLEILYVTRFCICLLIFNCYFNPI